jgi:DDE superfamily endonuclease
MLGQPKPSTPKQPSAKVRAATPAPATSTQATAIRRTDAKSIPAGIHQQPGGPYQLVDPRWAKRRRLLKEDPQYEWKTPIEFYGKVLDEHGNPVVGATADISWTDMSLNGSSNTQVTSDGAGLFVDNYATHKHPSVTAWIEKHPRFHLHFIPTSSSWLNLVERWFAEITRKRIRRGSFKSVADLIEAIQLYIDHNNSNPKPFVWTKRVDQILEKVARCKDASVTAH